MPIDNLLLAEPLLKVNTLDKKKYFSVDCWEHDAVSTTCNVQRYFLNGRLDSSFETFFTVDLINSTEHEIKAVFGLEPRLDGSVCIAGSFVSPLIHWTHQQAVEEMDKTNERGDSSVGEAPGKTGIVCVNENGQFHSFKAKTYEEFQKEYENRSK